MNWRKSLPSTTTGLPILILVGLPLVLLLANRSWIWDNPDFNDTSVYVSFFRHYLEWKWPFVENYKSSRLPWVLPGVAAYKLLPPAAAHHVLYLTFLAGETLLVYGLARRRFGAHAAFVAAAAVATSTFSHRATSYHNQAASTYFLASLYLLEEPRSWSHTRRAFAAGAALALSATTDSIVLALGPAFALHALATLPLPTRPVWWLPTARAVLHRALIVIAGMAAALGVFGAINFVLGGPFFFFIEQITYSIDISHSWALSTVPVPAFVTDITSHPLTAMPVVVLAGLLLFFVVRTARRQWDFAVVEVLVFAGTMAAAAAMQARNMGVLQMHILMHPFFAPMYLALAVLIGARWAPPRGAAAPVGAPQTGEAQTLSVPFLIGVAVCFLVPLSLFGAPISRLLLRLSARSPSLTFGVPVLLALTVIAAVAAVLLRRRPGPKLLAIAACLGVANAACTEDSQPGHMYQVGQTCPFRGEMFDAMISGDPVIAAFDPTNRARWKGSPMTFTEPQFDGQGWCTKLPLPGASNAVLLMHYFFTSAQLVHGYTYPPLKKFTIAANSDPEMDSLTQAVQNDLPSGYRLVRAFDWRKKYQTFTQILRGYDVEPDPPPGAH